jgi:hypothetical protein
MNCAAEGRVNGITKAPILAGFHVERSGLAFLTVLFTQYWSL